MTLEEMKKKFYFDMCDDIWRRGKRHDKRITKLSEIVEEVWHAAQAEKQKEIEELKAQLISYEINELGHLNSEIEKRNIKIADLEKKYKRAKNIIMASCLGMILENSDKFDCPSCNNSTTGCYTKIDSWLSADNLFNDDGSLK